MIQPTASSVGAANGSIPFQLSVLQVKGNGGTTASPARFGQKSAFGGCVSSTCTLSNQYPNSGLKSRRGGAARGVRFSTSSPPAGSSNFSNDGVRILRVCAKRAVQNGSSSQAQAGMQNSGVLSVSETPSLSGSDDEEIPASDKVSGESSEDETAVTELLVAGRESDSVSSESVENEANKFVQQYELTDEGNLSPVIDAMGGNEDTIRSRFALLFTRVGLLAESLKIFLQTLSVSNLIQNCGAMQPGVEHVHFNIAALYEPKKGLSNVCQWTATELGLQRAQMLRVAKDTLFLVWAFSFFGVVRILEAVIAVFAASPPNFKRLLDVSNAIDPFTVATLAYGLRQPIVGMLQVDPTNLDEVYSLKAKFWKELHKFYERQWKVIATLGFARLLTVTATLYPSAVRVTSKVKVLWDVTLALPLF